MAEAGMKVQPIDSFDREYLVETGYRPLIRLADERRIGVEFVVGSAGDVYERRDRIDWLRDMLGYALDVPNQSLLVSLPGQTFSDAVTDLATLQLIGRFLSQGFQLTVLAGWSVRGAGMEGFGNSIHSWRKLGAKVGLDNFGYAPIPALWPSVFALDAVRIDARLLAMHAAGAMKTSAVSALIGFVRNSKIDMVIADGCASDAQARLARAWGATHGQGGQWGQLRIGRPRPEQPGQRPFMLAE